MSIIPNEHPGIEYPETDGEPIGETDWHIDWTLKLRELLKFRYRDRKVYVGSDLLVYYTEGVPRDFVVPDGFVVLDCESRRRRNFKIWEEDRVPNAVFEFTSASTRRNDEYFKPRIYAKIGVPEYFIFDPHSEYLSPELQGFRLTEDLQYVDIEHDSNGRLPCQELGLTLESEQGELVIRDQETGCQLLTEAETYAAELAELREELKRRDQEN